MSEPEADGLDRSPEEIKRKLEELGETDSPIHDGPGGRDEAYRMDGKMKALRWVLGADYDL